MNNYFLTFLFIVHLSKILLQVNFIDGKNITKTNSIIRLPLHSFSKIIKNFIQNFCDKNAIQFKR